MFPFDVLLNDASSSTSSESYSNIPLFYTFSVFLLGFFGAAVSECLSWYYVYNTEEFRLLLADINKTGISINSQRKSIPKSGKAAFKFKTREDQLNQKNSSLSFLKMKTQLFASVLYFIMVPILNRFVYY